MFSTIFISSEHCSTFHLRPHPPHRVAALQRGFQPVYTKNAMFRALASSPTQVTCNIHAAIPMRSATPIPQDHRSAHARTDPKHLEGTVSVREWKNIKARPARTRLIACMRVLQLAACSANPARRFTKNITGIFQFAAATRWFIYSGQPFALPFSWPSRGKGTQ